MAIRISSPEIIDRPNMLELSARVGSPAFPAGLPERMIWSVKRDSGVTFSDRSDAFLIGVLPVAMRLGQNVEIEGEISTRLAQGIETYQDILSTWWPQVFRRVEVSMGRANPRNMDRRPAGVGCCFSGGVDSFSAVQALRPPLNRFPEFGITHAMMINGFDQIVDLNQTGVSRQMLHVYSKALEQWGVRLVMIHSNLKLFRDAVFRKHELTASFGSPLTACAHALSPVFGRFNLSGHATYRYEDLKPIGSHPMLDHHLSTDQLQIIHLGASLSRSEKLERMVSETPVRQSLRVCFRSPKFVAETGEVLNCGACEKCVRTIVMLDIIGQLENFPTFRHRADISAYKVPGLLSKIPAMFLQDMIRMAQRHQRDDWLILLKQSARLQTSREAGVAN